MYAKIAFVDAVLAVHDDKTRSILILVRILQVSIPLLSCDYVQDTQLFWNQDSCSRKKIRLTSKQLTLFFQFQFTNALIFAMHTVQGLFGKQEIWPPLIMTLGLIADHTSGKYRENKSSVFRLFFLYSLTQKKKKSILGNIYHQTSKFKLQKL